MNINGQSYEAIIVEYNKYQAKVNVNGVDFTVDFGEDEEVTQPHSFKAPVVSSSGGNIEQAPKPKPVTPTPPPPQTPKPVQSADSKFIKAPLPGTVFDIRVEVGQSVKANQAVLVLEAMKMESEIYSEYDGVIKSILVEKGQSVQDGQALIEIEG
jgi:biotin carboxyl carrier protein